MKDEVPHKRHKNWMRIAMAEETHTESEIDRKKVLSLESWATDRAGRKQDRATEWGKGKRAPMRETKHMYMSDVDESVGNDKIRLNPNDLTWDWHIHCKMRLTYARALYVELRPSSMMLQEKLSCFIDAKWNIAFPLPLLLPRFTPCRRVYQFKGIKDNLY